MSDVEGRKAAAGAARDDHAPAAPLGRLLAQAERLVSRRIEAALAEHGLTADQWRVLDLLADGEGHAMSEIVAAIVVPGPTLTKIVDRLVDAAAVYRLVDVRDRRRVLAFLSESGKALHSACTRRRGGGGGRAGRPRPRRACAARPPYAPGEHAADPVRAPAVDPDRRPWLISASTSNSSPSALAR